MSDQKDLTYALVLPERVIQHHFHTLMKRRNKPNMPQFVMDKFDGDEQKTKIWIEEKEGEFILMSQYEGRPFKQQVMTYKEAMGLMKEGNETPKAVSLKAKLMNIFVEIGNTPDDALENACNVVANYDFHTPNEYKGSIKMLCLFALMKERGVKADVLRVSKAGNLVLGVSPEYEDKMNAIHQELGLGSEGAVEATEENEDPRVE